MLYKSDETGHRDSGEECQTKELAQDALVHLHVTAVQVTRTTLVVHAGGTLLLLLQFRVVDVKGRRKEYWHIHCQQQPTCYLTEIYAFHILRLDFSALPPRGVAKRR